MQSLIQKYNVPGPRYTSYPTVPYWDGSTFSNEIWKDKLVESFSMHNTAEGISLYIHLPFCESLCTFCGCNKRITKRHELENPYILAVLKEWQLYLDILPKKPLIKEIHLGGGTPTFFSPENLTTLIQGILKGSTLSPSYEFSFEGHPNNTTKEHLQALYDFGFRRVSYGVQDYNMAVQIAIHRIQPFENVQRVTEMARQIGYTSVSHDIIFGLPMQTLKCVEKTIQKTGELLPDRIAFYSYAHVPWIKGNGQRGYSEKDLPSASLKREQYEKGKKALENMGYIEVGMDHFALPTDELFVSLRNKSLHRNFMGYTTTQSKIMLGLGVSAISDSWTAFGQNVKEIEAYYALLAKNEIPVYRGHILNKEDQIVRQHILNLMCHLETSWNTKTLMFPELEVVLKSLEEMQEENLIQINHSKLTVTEKGRPFVRNVCMAFDLLLQRKQPESQLFSMTV